MVFQTAVAILDWSGVIVFAISGALVASRKQMDIVGFVLLGTVTGIGGGTLRDVLLGANPVFWINEPAYLVACVAVSGIVFFTAHIPQSRYKLLLWFDALGLGIFAVVGAEKALLMGAGPTVAIAMGVITATFGGILRDLLGAESPVVLSREIYVTAALAGAVSFRRRFCGRPASRGRRRRGCAHRFWIARRRHSARLVIATLQVTPRPVI
jgi:uncharacterized membrane protein YeiH